MACAGNTASRLTIIRFWTSTRTTTREGRDDEPALTASFEKMPAGHDGERRFGFEIVFSEEFRGLKLTAFEAGALEVAGGRLVVDAKRVTRGENRRVAVRVVGPRTRT